MLTLPEPISGYGSRFTSNFSGYLISGNYTVSRPFIKTIHSLISIIGGPLCDKLREFVL